MRSKKRTKGEGLSWHVEAEWGQATLDTVTGAEEEGSLATPYSEEEMAVQQVPWLHLGSVGTVGFVCFQQNTS